MKVAIAGAIVTILLSISIPIDALTCLSCNAVTDIQECVLNSAVCQDSTEQCYLDVTIKENLQRVFTAGCRATDVCNILSSLGKRDIQKRESIACAECCN